MPMHLQATIGFSLERCDSDLHLQRLPTRADEACGGGRAGLAWAMEGQSFGFILVSRSHLVSLGKAATQLVASSGFYWLNNGQLENLASWPCLHLHVNVVIVSSWVQHPFHTSLPLSQPPSFAYIFKKGLCTTVKVT